MTGSQGSNASRPHPAKMGITSLLEPPSYDFVLDWMRYAPRRAAVLDFWARGNYARRLLHLRTQAVRPLLVRVTQLDEIRWAYRRLALLGVPVEFVYCGGDCRSEQVSMMCPSDRIEGGGGYIGIADDSWEYRGRRWFPVVGFAHTMPEAILDWEVDEESVAFREGRIFVSPAALVGIDPAPGNLGALVDMARGIPVLPGLEAGRAIMELDLPYLDRMSPRQCAKFLLENEGELVRFRAAFQRLFQSDNPDDARLKDYIDELKHEIAELTVSDKYKALRTLIAKLGGAIAVLTASMSIALKATPSTVEPVLVGTAAGAAAVALLEILKQKTERNEQLSRNPFCVLWQLGVSRPSKVKRRGRVVTWRVPRLPIEHVSLPRENHWLRPPTEGLRWLVEVSGR